MQHQTLTLSRMRDYIAARYLTRDGYRSVNHYAQGGPDTAREQAIAMFESAIADDGAAFDVLNVLSIDAWRNPAGWFWNAWYKRGTLTRREFVRECGDTTSRKGRRRALRWFRDNGYLHNETSQGRVTLEDDGYNLTVQDRRTGEPLYAIEYGPLYN